MRFVCCAIGALVTLSLSADAQKVTAVQVLNGSLAHYDSAKTFQGTLKIAGKRKGVDFTRTMDIKAETDGKGSIVRSVIRISTNAKGPKGAQTGQQMVVDDGKTVFVADLTNKRYFSQPRRAGRVSQLFAQALTNLGKAGGGLAVEEKVVNGRSTYALTAKSGKPNILILVDKASKDLKSLTLTDKEVSSTLTVAQQAFNKPIPASTFAWAPPKDFKVMTRSAPRS